MNTESWTEQNFVSSLARKYEGEGYEVSVEPVPDSIPFDLGGYRPDILARKGGESLLIEVRAQAEKVSLERLRSIVEKVKEHQGWHFILITDKDAAAPGLRDGDFTPATWDEISARITHAQQFGMAKEHEAAYLLLWIAFEQMLRRLANDTALPLNRLTPSFLIRQLYSDGELSASQFDDALECQEERNRIVHGFGSGNVSAYLGRLETLVSTLFRQWSVEDQVSRPM